MHRVDGNLLYQNHMLQVGQNGQNVAQTTATPTARMTSIQQELMNLVKGTVFEGVITEMKDGYAILGLDSGQTLAAKLESGVNVQLGEPVLLEVKSNQDNQIVLKQVPVKSEMNPAFQKALTAAGLPLTERNLDMVNTMMQKQMPIDKESLNNMARVLQSYPEVSPETLVQMEKLGFTINETSVQQFEAYKAGENSLLNRFAQMMEQIPDLVGELGMETEIASPEKQMLELQKGLLDALEVSGKSQQNPEGEKNLQTNAGTHISGEIPVSSDVFSKEMMQITLTNFMSREEIKTLEQQLKQLPGMEDNTHLFLEEQLNTSLSAKEMLETISKQLEQLPEGNEKALKELFSGKEYKALLKQVMSEQWLLQPEQVENKDNVEQLYERMNRQMEKLERFLQNTGREEMALNKNISQVRGNLDMMNQINQLYNYIQIPLKLQNQNAHSDLYVYTNKKRLMDKDGELSALLHLELEHLGTTDVHIKMLGNKVTTNFCLADEAALDLIEAHIDELEKNLERKGYQCSFQVENRQEKVDFVKDFLEKEVPVGKVQRYSFDVLT